MEIQLICPHSPCYHPIKSPFQSPLDEEEIGVKVTSFWMRQARLYNWKHSDVRLSLSQVKKKKKTDWPAFPGVSAPRWMFENESNHFTEAEMGSETTISSDCSSCGRIRVNRAEVDSCNLWLHWRMCEDCSVTYVFCCCCWWWCCRCWRSVAFICLIWYMIDIFGFFNKGK